MGEMLPYMNYVFSDEEKERCIPIIDRIVQLVNTVRKNGILVLEGEIEQERSFFLKQAMELVLDGTDPVLVKRILQNIISADRYEGYALLSRLLYMEGILALQQGENPRIIMLKLSAMLGERYIASTIEAIHAKKRGATEAIDRFGCDHNENVAFAESGLFERELLLFDDRSLQTIIQKVDWASLMLALKGCSGRVMQRVYANLPPNLKATACEDWDLMGPVRKEDIFTSQQKILKAIDTLSDSGEIIRANLVGSMDRTAALKADRILSQEEIDKVVEALRNGTLKGWRTSREASHSNRTGCEQGQVIYVIEDYDLFYCHYALEELTSCLPNLRRYGYGDTESFKQFKFFIVLEDYKSKGINAVLVVGIPSTELCKQKDAYIPYQESGVAYLVDASSLSYAFLANDIDSIR